MARHSTLKAGGSDDIGNLARAAAVRRRAAWNLPMRERLAQVHRLCQQIGSIKDASRVR